MQRTGHARTDREGYSCAVTDVRDVCFYGFRSLLYTATYCRGGSNYCNLYMGIEHQYFFILYAFYKTFYLFRDSRKESTDKDDLRHRGVFGCNPGHISIPKRNDGRRRD